MLKENLLFILTYQDLFLPFLKERNLRNKYPRKNQFSGMIFVFMKHKNKSCIHSFNVSLHTYVHRFDLAKSTVRYHYIVINLF